LEYYSCSNYGYGYGPGSWYLYGDHYRRGRLYDDGYGYHHRTCCGAGSEHHSHYERKLLWRGDRFGYGDGYRWYGSLHLQLEYDPNSNDCYGYWSGSGNLYGDDHGWGRMYYYGYCYYYPAGCIFNCFYNCPDQCELLRRHDWFRYGNCDGWFSSLHLQLEYYTRSNNRYGYGSGSGHLYGDYYGCGRLYDDGLCYYYPAGCIFNCFYHRSDRCKLLWWGDGFSYGDCYWWYGSLHL